MNEKPTFFDQYRPVFEVVCRMLGGNWRVNLLDDCQYRIKLTSPDFRGFIIIVRQEQGRLVLTGFVDSRLYRGTYFKCTVASDRKPDAIAQTITRKILCCVREELIKAREIEKSHQDAREQDKIIKGMLSRLVKLESHYNAFTGFRADNDLRGDITKRFDGYGLTVQGLTVEQLVKLTGIINTI
ncbi:TPA: hypothetical protein ACHK3Z_004798 [Escherichia coli]|uniref:Uncharacterized protein n=1 Tax=Xenorhabdus mauleonii TaxID=351675 RepID=A0A1I3XBT8_9GAMM|nr:MULTISPECIES: hypothetical protein [Enterobacterales]EEP1426244.1 hypothetical protein [Salmonella enterica]ELB1288582.1 hypothetical protein [Morganella morganii]EHM1965611.1 hypothetical protein [Escherichia coli]EKT8676456.1 hypothetical protein [Proteus mirabilis]ELA6789760.1 hypothetical protein [Proteus mirabilis]